MVVHENVHIPHTIQPNKAITKVCNDVLRKLTIINCHNVELLLNPVSSNLSSHYHNMLSLSRESKKGLLMF